jgi:hypothetical protein
MIKKLRAAHVDDIIIMTPPPVDDSQARYKDGHRSNERVKMYADAAIAVAKEAGLPYVDVFNGFQVGGGPGRRRGFWQVFLRTGVRCGAG